MEGLVAKLTVAVYDVPTGVWTNVSEVESTKRCESVRNVAENVADTTDATTEERYAQLVNLHHMTQAHWPRNWNCFRHEAHKDFLKLCVQHATSIMTETDPSMIVVKYRDAEKKAGSLMDTRVGSCAFTLFANICQVRCFELLKNKHL